MSGPALGAIAAQAARKYAARSCLSYAGRDWNYAEFEAAVSVLSSGLAARLPAGARVALFMANRPEYLFLQLALERAGLVRVPLNARFTTHEVCVILEDCGADALFFDRSTADRAAEASLSIPGLWCCQAGGKDVANGATWSELNNTSAARVEAREISSEDLCSINYTSGTSGKPKGVMLTHRNWSAMIRNMLVDRDMRADDVVAHIGPLTHSSGAYFLPWFLRGARSVIVEGGGVDQLLETIPRERVTAFTCVPTLLTRVVNHAGIGRVDLGSLRAIGYGAEPIPFNTLEKALRLFGPILTQNYGQTEAMMTVTLLRPEEHFAPQGKDAPSSLRVGCIGRPYSFVEVALRAGDGRVVEAGEVGEITVSSEHVMGGYWNRREETDKVLRQGWLWTGDLATRDAEGYITLAGRSKDMLISGGYNVYPAEIEALLTSHPDVLEAAVVGLPDPDWGERVVACVSAAPGRSIEVAALVSHCKPILGFRTPKQFMVIEALPKNANGKVDKGVLKSGLLEEGAGVTHD